MPTILGSRADKESAINMLEHILHAFVMNGLTHQQRSNVLQHVTWLHRQQDGLYVNCQLETIPEIKLTRLTLEYSFKPIPSLKTN